MLEKLIEVLAALVAAINANTAALSQSPVASVTTEEKKTRGKKTETVTPAPETPAATTTPPPPAAPSVQDLRTAATALVDACTKAGQDANNNDALTLFSAINKEQNTKKISDVPEAVRADVIKRINAQIDATVKAAMATSAI